MGNVKQLMRIRQQLMLAVLALVMVVITGCPVKMVPPYDDKLFNDTEAFFKKADVMIEEGKTVSPRTDEERKAIVVPTTHPGHTSSFTQKYDALLLDADVLILRAVANSQGTGKISGEIQKKIADVIDKSLPSACLNEFNPASDLTAMNFVDLKCIVIKWKRDHSDPTFTHNTGVMKQANWEGRKISLFDTILAIQSAEGFKKSK